MQHAQVLLGDPDSMASQLNTLASTEEIITVVKTISSGSFIIVSDDAGTVNQTVGVLRGDPDNISSQLDVIIGLGNTIDCLESTFSSSSYLAVYR